MFWRREGEWGREGTGSKDLNRRQQRERRGETGRKLQWLSADLMDFGSRDYARAY
jgi:hypothetical protein